MTPDEHVTPAHLASVRAELDAKVLRHRAEIDKELGILASEVRASSAEQSRNHLDVKRSLDGLAGEVAVLANTVDSLDGNQKVVEAVHAAVAGLKRTFWKNLAAVLTVAAAVGGVVIAAWPS